MKFLQGSDLAGFIKERQVRQVRTLRQAHNVTPGLAIILTNPTPVINTYIKLKQAYGKDIGVEVAVYRPDLNNAPGFVSQLNHDPTIHGIIVQLPLANPDRTDELVNTVSPRKDVDGLGANAALEPATPMAVNWLLAGYNIELRGKKIVIVGQGRLVGRPLAKMFTASGLDVQIADKSTKNLQAVVRQADILITGTGVPGLITSDMVPPNTVVVDAGVASEGGKLRGDLADELYKRSDLTITPAKGGVGPLTVCALFDNVIRAALAAIVV